MTTNIFSRYLSILGIHSTSDFASEIYESEPFKNSFYGISTLLSRYGIFNECLRFENKTELNDKLSPFLVIFNGSFKIVTSVSNEHVTILDANNNSSKISKEEFLNDWNGVALFATPSERSCEPDSKIHQKKEWIKKIKIAGLAGATVIASIISIVTTGSYESLTWWLLVIANISGIGISILLLRKQLNISDRITEKICSFSGEHQCDNVTSSDASSFFGLFKLSEVGFSFFLMNLIVLLLFPSMTFWMAIAVVCSLPFTFWSVWYQRFRVHSWCALCLMTLSILWIQVFICFFGGLYHTPYEELTSGILLLCGYVIATLLINRLMEILSQFKDFSKWKYKYYSLKLDEKVIDAFEGGRSQIDVSPEKCTSLIFGNPDASHSITIFSNPFCNPCAMMHKRVNDFPSDVVNIRYVMTYFSEDRSIINRYIIAAYQQLGAEATWNLLEEWFDYGKNEGERFFEKLNLDPYSEEVNKEFEKQNSWRANEGKAFSGTPTILINGREIVTPYVVEDHLYL